MDGEVVMKYATDYGIRQRKNPQNWALETDSVIDIAFYDDKIRVRNNEAILKSAQFLENRFGREESEKLRKSLMLSTSMLQMDGVDQGVIPTMVSS